MEVVTSNIKFYSKPVPVCRFDIVVPSLKGPKSIKKGIYGLFRRVHMVSSEVLVVIVRV